MTTTANHRPPATFADLPRLMSLMTGDDKHDQAATSTLDVLWVLYDRVCGSRRRPPGTTRGTAS
jgi:transketolase